MKRKSSLFLKAFAIGLSVMMIGSACSKPPAPAATDAKPAETKTDAKPEEKAPETADKSADVPTLTWIMGDPGTIPSDQAKVEEKLNEISVEKVGAKVKTLYYNAEKVKLAMSAGEDWDMVFTCEWYNDFAVQARAGYYADITEGLKSVTPKLYETMPEVVWKGAQIEGKIFAIPVKKDYAAEQYYIFDKNLFVDNLKMEIPEKMGFADVEQYLKAAKDAFTAGNEAAKQAEYPMKLIKGGFAGIDSNFDLINRDMCLGIPYSAVGTADATKVVFTPEVPEMVDRLKLLHKWYEAGYINKDAATLNDAGKYTTVGTGQGFYGVEAIWSGANGYPVVVSKRDGPYLSTASVRGSMNAINVNSKHIDLALKYQELVNTDQNYRDMLRYGIEGDHWNKTPEGLAEKTQAGRDAYSPWAFSQGSYSLSSVEAAKDIKVDPKMWDVIFEGYKELVATDTIGFSFDITNVETQVAATKAVKDKYWEGLITGTLDPETTLPTMISEMESAGLRDIQKECQTQLDAFIAANK